MFDTTWIGDLDADAACASIASTQDRLRAHEWTELALAAHWAVLHDGETLQSRAGVGRVGGVLPGTERAIRVGGHGTPVITEFASAELGLVMAPGSSPRTPCCATPSTSNTATRGCGRPWPPGRVECGRPARSPG